MKKKEESISDIYNKMTEKDIKFIMNKALDSHFDTQIIEEEHLSPSQKKVEEKLCSMTKKEAIEMSENDWLELIMAWDK